MDVPIAIPTIIPQASPSTKAATKEVETPAYTALKNILHSSISKETLSFSTGSKHSTATKMPGMPDDEWAEVEETVPAFEEPFIQKYIAGREALIAEEKKKRSDYAFRQSLSPVARDACRVAERIRREEQDKIWNPSMEERLANKEKESLYPGMMFSLAKDTMERTRLYQIVKRMPKGALLHAHMDAMVDFDYLFDVLLREEGMHILCSTPLSTLKENEIGLLQFCYRNSPTAKTNIWSSDYKLNEPVPVTQAAEQHPGGSAGFIAYLKSRFTITREESTEHKHGVNHVWRRFQSVFSMINGIAFYEPIFRKFIQRMLTLLNQDGVRWVDLRLAFGFRYHRRGNEIPDEGYGEMFRVFGEELEKFKHTPEGTGFWGARMIWTGIRALGKRSIIEDMDNCISIKIAYPHLISGYDLVGQEDLGRPLKDILPELFWFRKQCKEEGVEIPFFFHAGETLGDGCDTDQNLFDAILLGTRRIGHGFSLYKHPLLIEMVKEKKILVESCPISNEVLRLCTSILSHPLPALIARGVSCSLCNDDPGILGQDTAGSTHDFWQALQGWENLGLAGLGALAQNSVRWAAFEDQDAKEWTKAVEEGALGKGVRGERMRGWGLEWEEFCLWVVTEFGEESDLAENVEDASLEERR